MNAGVRGTTDECFSHFVAAFKGSRNKRIELAEHVGVTVDSTIRRWFAGQAKPTGAHRIHLRTFLENHGYEVIGKDKVPKHSLSKRDTPAKGRLNGYGDHSLMIRTAASLISGLIPITDFLLSDACSPEDRSRLHELAGADSVLMLTSRLRRLCSETARRKL